MPSPADLALCLEFVGKERARLSASTADAKALAGGNGTAREGALVGLARVLLNLDEAVTRP